MNRQLIQLVICLYAATNLFASNVAAQVENIVEPDIPYYQYLYSQEDYYRTISEILKLRFHYKNQEIDQIAELHLLASQYHLGQFEKLELNISGLLKEESVVQDTNFSNRLNRILSLSLATANKNEESRKIWKECCESNTELALPDKNSIDGQLDPNLAKALSSVIPGSGMVYTGDYKKALISFALNAAFIWGIVVSATNEDYGLAGLLLFFEIGWYSGGREASYESAINFNKKIFEKKRNDWIEIQSKKVFP